MTHSLIGVLLGSASARFTGSLRGAIWAAVLGSNLPDVDFVITPFLADPRLSYLVHHRGYTHTLLLAPLLAVVPLLVARWRAPECRALPTALLALVSVVLHVGADGWNHYGIHPLWPVEPRWMYGDVLFIVEPWLWVALLPLAWSLASRPWRWALGAIALCAVGLSAFVLGPTMGIAVAVGLRLVLAAQRARGGPLPAMLAMGLTLAAFTSGSRLADAVARDAVADAPGELVEVVRSPRPGSPWCWEIVTTHLDGDRWVARPGRVSLLPDLVSPEECALGPDERTAPATPPDLPDRLDLAWRPAFVGSVAELRALAASECRADAFLRYARVPFWQVEPASFVMGDLRYDREAGLGFAEVRSAWGDHAGCGGLPSWRSDASRRLLGER